MSMPAYAPPPNQRRWTVEMLDTIPADGNRYEIIDGDLHVTPAPSPTHQRACAELYKALWPYLDRHGIGELFFSPIDVEFAPDTMVEPDLVLFPPQAGPLPPRFRGSDGALLAIEVLSPSTARSDRQKKRALYQRERVPEYWIVDRAVRSERSHRVRMSACATFAAERIVWPCLCTCRSRCLEAGRSTISTPFRTTAADTRSSTARCT